MLNTRRRSQAHLHGAHVQAPSRQAPRAPARVPRALIHVAFYTVHLGTYFQTREERGTIQCLIYPRISTTRGDCLMLLCPTLDISYNGGTVPDVAFKIGAGCDVLTSLKVVQHVLHSNIGQLDGISTEEEP